MGSGPNDTEIRIFIVLTIALALSGMIFGLFVFEFVEVAIEEAPPGHMVDLMEEITSRPKVSAAAGIIGGMMSMFIPFASFLMGFPAILSVLLTIIQIIWIYLLIAVLIRPFIPLT